MRKTLVAVAISAAVSLSACSDNEQQATANQQAEQQAAEATQQPAEQQNPFFTASTLQYEAPDFNKIKFEHFAPAFERGMAEHMAEIEAIANNSEQPTFENTIVAMERAGKRVNRVLYTFSSLTGTELDDELRALQTEIWPMWSRESDAITLNERM